jgi:hypothetical protein
MTVRISRWQQAQAVAGFARNEPARFEAMVER